MIIEQQIKKLLADEGAELEVPSNPAHGEFSSNIAMKMAKQLKRKPQDVAQEIVDKMDLTNTFIAKVEVAGPGFINFYATDEWYQSVPLEIAIAGDEWGKNDSLKGEKINVEFVSANPTGPMHIGNARGGALGDSLAKVMKMCGAEVVKEFYLNDTGNQIEKFRNSLDARFRQLQGEDVDFKEDWYQGRDIIDHAQRWLDEGHTTSEGLAEDALERNIADMERILRDYNIEYDVWFRESSLYKDGFANEILQKLIAAGATYEKDGAVYLKTSVMLGKDGEGKDDVLIRSNGIPTYFMSDIAYHYNKFVERGFTRSIDVWGADHGGHVDRVKKGIEYLGMNPDKFDVKLIQLVKLLKNGEVVKMSKRKGDAIGLEDLVEEIGKDSARFFFNMQNAKSRMNFDLDLAVKQSSDNPVFYVQYAHARICSILDKAGIQFNKNLKLEDLGGGNMIVTDSKGIKYNYNTKEERDLIRRIAMFPREVAAAGEMLEPSGLTTYVRSLAGEFHSFYSKCPIKREENEDVRSARLLLAQAAKQTIKNTLDILGVDAPEHMDKKVDNPTMSKTL
ncbi:MAG: arginine--tRNA ligase [Clostridiales bacterium]|jgi:arginyl-tRNA synthetase|nr:arginine--tRNA ligase [Clostridiales bacterium]